MRVVFAGKEIIIQKTKEICEKGLTTEAKSDIIIKRSKRGTWERPRDGCERESGRSESVAACRRTKANEKNFEKLSENLLTNGTESGIIIKRLKMRVQKIPTGRKPMGERNGFRSLSKDLRKKLQKTFRKPLDKQKEMWYNIQAVAKRWHGTAR